MTKAPVCAAAAPAPFSVSGPTAAPNVCPPCNEIVAPFATVIDEVLPSAPVICRLSTPPFTDVAPVKVFATASARVPTSFFVKPPAPSTMGLPVTRTVPGPPTVRPKPAPVMPPLSVSVPASALIVEAEPSVIAPA